MEHQQRRGAHKQTRTATRAAMQNAVTHENTARDGDPLGRRRVAVGAERREAAEHGGVRRVQRAIARPAALHRGRHCVALAAVARLPRTASAPARRRRLDARLEEPFHVVRNRGAPQRPILRAARLEVDHPSSTAAHPRRVDLERVRERRAVRYLDRAEQNVDDVHSREVVLLSPALVEERAAADEAPALLPLLHEIRALLSQPARDYIRRSVDEVALARRRRRRWEAHGEAARLGEQRGAARCEGLAVLHSDRFDGARLRGERRAALPGVARSRRRRRVRELRCAQQLFERHRRDDELRAPREVDVVERGDDSETLRLVRLARRFHLEQQRGAAVVRDAPCEARRRRLEGARRRLEGARAPPL
jgi:hypothetical protein